MNLDFNLHSVPEIVYDRHPEYAALYNRAWEIAADHIVDLPGLPVEHHMDEGFAPDRLWIWDTCFMAHYCKYSTEVFPGIQSLDNFYLPIHDYVNSSCLIQHPGNPPLFAWVEHEYYRFTGDKERIYRNLVEKQYLQKHYDFFESAKIGERHPFSFALNMVQKNECGYLWTGTSSGMDNTPRGNDFHLNIYWIDAISQQALSAFYIARMARIIGEKEVETDFTARYEEKKNIINQYYFDEKDGSYYDIYTATHTPFRILTPASFWPLLAEAASPDQARQQIRTLLDPSLLGGEIPAPSVARNSPFFEPDGRYWRGGVWLPTSYMVAKAFEKYSYYDLAAEFADRTVGRMSEVYENYSPQTIWEAYAPSQPTPAASTQPGTVSRADFCGWSALGPISMLIENVLGFHSVDAAENKIGYHHRPIGRHGIRNFRFGSIVCDIVANNTTVKVKSNQTFTLEIDGTPYICHSGHTEIDIAGFSDSKTNRIEIK